MQTRDRGDRRDGRGISSFNFSAQRDQQQTGAGAGANTKHTPVSPSKDLGARVTKVSLHFLKTIYFPPAVARRLLIHH